MNRISLHWPADRPLFLQDALDCLVKQCLEYIIVHELAYLPERHHNDRFVALMDQYPADRSLRRDLLNKSPLAHEAWDY